MGVLNISYNKDITDLFALVDMTELKHYRLCAE